MIRGSQAGHALQARRSRLTAGVALDERAEVARKCDMWERHGVEIPDGIDTVRVVIWNETDRRTAR